MLCKMKQNMKLCFFFLFSFYSLIYIKLFALTYKSTGMKKWRIKTGKRTKKKRNTTTIILQLPPPMSSLCVCALTMPFNSLEKQKKTVETPPSALSCAFLGVSFFFSSHSSAAIVRKESFDLFFLQSALTQKNLSILSNGAVQRCHSTDSQREEGLRSRQG